MVGIYSYNQSAIAGSNCHSETPIARHSGRRTGPVPPMTVPRDACNAHRPGRAEGQLALMGAGRALGGVEAALLLAASSTASGGVTWTRGVTRRVSGSAPEKRPVTAAGRQATPQNDPRHRRAPLQLGGLWLRGRPRGLPIGHRSAAPRWLEINLAWALLVSGYVSSSRSAQAPVTSYTFNPCGITMGQSASLGTFF